MRQAENFRNFLVEHGVYEKFCANIKMQRGNSFNDVVDQKIGLRSIIDSELTWANTPEGSAVWSNLNSLWNTGLKQGKQYKLEYKSIW